MFLYAVNPFFFALVSEEATFHLGHRVALKRAAVKTVGPRYKNPRRYNSS